MAGAGLGGTSGEVLFAVPYITILWNNSDVGNNPGDSIRIDAEIPDVPILIGLDLYAQGVLYTIGNIKLTEGLKIELGVPLI